MKKLIISISIIFCTVLVYGQGKENIAISIVVSRQVDYLDASQSVRLGKKMSDIAVKTGLSAAKKTSGIIMYPVFSIESEEVVEGGMQKIIVVSADISFLVKHVESEIIFASHNVQIRGSGSTRKRAIDDVITRISVRDADFNQFVVSARQKIFDYFVSNCMNIQLTAQSYAKRNEYETAIALLASVPDVAPCYPQMLKEIESIYPAYQEQKCKELLQKALSLYSAHEYIEALYVLHDLKFFDTDCANDANALSLAIEAKLTVEEQREWDFMIHESNNRAALTEKRLEVIQAIAVSYYNRKISNNYNVLVF